MGIGTTLTRMWLTKSLKPFAFTNEYDNEPDYKNTRKLGLYIHIPFCRSLCDFCPYCKVVYDEEQGENYVAALLKEIDLVGNRLGSGKKEVTSLYFGGGTPALLSDYVPEIMERIHRYFIVTEGVGLELHPQDVTEETLRRLKNAGITKISIGIQSFQPEYLKLLGRSESHWEAMFEALSKVEFETVSMDFIFALPGQTIETLRQDIDTAFFHGANHIAVYPFIDFTFTERKFAKIKEKEKRKLLYDMVDYCAEKGYARDSIWTFSKEETAKYSSMTRECFLGFGCSATTLLEGQFKINTFSVDEYVKRIQANLLPTALTLRFTRRQRMVYYLFWAAYTTRLDSKDFEAFFGCGLEGKYGAELILARLLGLIKKEGTQYAMTTKGSYYYHYYENFYTLSYIDSMWNLMGKTPFPDELAL